MAYDASTLALTNETVIANGATNSIARSYDTLGRASGIALDANYAVDYAYDSAGRFAAVTSSVMSVSSVADYSYLSGSDMLSGYKNDALGRRTERKDFTQGLAVTNQLLPTKLISYPVPKL